MNPQSSNPIEDPGGSVPPVRLFPINGTEIWWRIGREQGGSGARRRPLGEGPAERTAACEERALVFILAAAPSPTPETRENPLHRLARSLGRPTRDSQAPLSVSLAHDCGGSNYRPPLPVSYINSPSVVSRRTFSSGSTSPDGGGLIIHCSRCDEVPCVVVG